MGLMETAMKRQVRYLNQFVTIETVQILFTVGTELLLEVYLNQ
jgi:hypothetical protein